MMQLIHKLSTAMRGGTREVLESAVDANALRILSQEIYECESSLRESKQHLAKVIAEKLSMKRQLEAHSQQIHQQEQRITQALAQQDEVSALQLAETLAQQEDWLAQQQEQYQQLQQYEQTLLQTLKDTAGMLGQYRSELNMARATQETQKTVGKLSAHANPHQGAFVNIQESLTRIRHKQTQFNDQLQAAHKVEDYLKGNSPCASQQRANDVLKRFRSA